MTRYCSGAAAGRMPWLGPSVEARLSAAVFACQGVSEIRGYQSSTCPSAVSRSWKGWIPIARRAGRYGQASPNGQGRGVVLPVSLRATADAVPVLPGCRGSARRALILGGPAKVRRAASRSSTTSAPAHSALPLGDGQPVVGAVADLEGVEVVLAARAHVRRPGRGTVEPHADIGPVGQRLAWVRSSPAGVNLGSAAVAPPCLATATGVLRPAPGRSGKRRRRAGRGHGHRVSSWPG
jgi:hypothetical protein